MVSYYYKKYNGLLIMHKCKCWLAGMRGGGEETWLVSFFVVVVVVVVVGYINN